MIGRGKVEAEQCFASKREKRKSSTREARLLDDFSGPIPTEEREKADHALGVLVMVTGPLGV